MIYLGDIVVDPDLAQPFTLWRSTGGSFQAGGWVEGTRTPVPVVGIITPLKPRDLEMLPEGDRVDGAMWFISRERIYVTHTDGVQDLNAGTSDVVTWRGEVYRVASVEPWVDFGFWKATGVRQKGA